MQIRTGAPSRRPLTTLLGVAPVTAAVLASLAVTPLAAQADEPYSDLELQARTNLLANDAGYNLPPGSSFNSISPQINESAEVSFRVQYVADVDPTIGRPGVWFGSGGEGEIVDTGEEGWLITGEAVLNDHGDIAYTYSQGGLGNVLYLYDGDDGSVSQVDTAPVLPNSYSDVGLDEDGGIGFQAEFFGGRAYAALVDGSGVFYVRDRALDANSPFTYLYGPSYNDAGQIAAKVSTSDDLSTEQELRLFEPDGTSTLLLANQAADPESPYKKFDNSIAVNDEGVIAAVATRVSDGAKVVVRTDGETVTEIAAAEADGPVRSIEYFRPDLNDSGQVVFRGVGPEGQAVFVGDGEDLITVAAKGQEVDVDLGRGQLGQHDSSPVFGGGPSINDKGDVVFTAGVHPKGDNKVEWGSGVFVAYAGVGGSQPPVGDAADQDIVATVPEGAGGGSLVISVDPKDRTVNLPEMTSLGDRLATSGELRPVTVTDSRTSDPGWDVSAQVSDFAAGGDEAFDGGFLGWSPLVQSASGGQDVTPGDTVQPGFPSGDGLSVPRQMASTEAGSGAGTAVLGAELDLEIPVTTDPGVYTAVLTITAI